MKTFLSPVLRALRSPALREDDAYSLTELMIVIVIIGILALLALPRFMNITTRAKTTEARTMLSHVASLQRSYRYERDVYSADLAAIGFEQERLAPEGGNARYRIAVEQADARGYVATATSVVDFDGDGTFNVWEINQDGLLKERTPD